MFNNLKAMHKITKVFTLALLCLTISSIVIADVRQVNLTASDSSSKSKFKKAAKKGLGKFPSVANAVKAKKKGKTKSLSHHDLGILDVSGTPPTLSSMSSSEIKNIFWRSGVVDSIANGTPDQTQCNEFFAGNNDGESGGLGACHLAESVGYSFQNMLQSAASTCYMQKFPTAANVAAGGVSVTSGSLPDGDISKIFSVPTGSTSRVVQVNVSGGPGGPEGEQGGPEKIFIKIYSENENKSSGKLYAADLWFCGDSDTPTGIEKLSLKNSGQFISTHAENRGENESNQSEVTGFLTLSGSNIIWDESRPRTAQFEARQGDNGSFKSEISIASNKITSKIIDTFGGFGLNKRYMETRFSGNNVADIKFLEGAFKEEHDGSDFSGATEYRSSYYAAAPDSSLLQSANNKNFSSDSFYSDEPSPEVDTTGFSCGVTPDISLSLDMNNSTVQASVASCENRLDNMHFCHENESVRSADMNYSNSCSQR